MKFTIITPSYNQGQYLESTIRSIINQDYPNIEYFVFDGNSTDHSQEVIRKYDSKITFWESEDDEGQSHAINKGLKRCTGDIITWINSDDQLLPGALNKANEYFIRNSKVSLIHGNTQLCNGKYEIRGAKEDHLPYEYLAGMAFPQPSSFFRSTSLGEGQLHLDQNLKYGMDFDLFARLYLNGDFLVVNDVFSKYLIHNESKTSKTNIGFAKDWAFVFSKILRTFNANIWINELRSLGLYEEEDTVYESSKSFDDSFIELVVQYFLLFQAHFYYNDLNLNTSLRIVNYLKRYHNDFFRNHRLSDMRLRASIPFSRYLIGLIRSIRSK